MSSISSIISQLPLPGLRFSVLVGSRSTGTHRPDSDWDIAVSWTPLDDPMAYLTRHESLRQDVSQRLGVPDSAIDLIDLAHASLAMRALVANEGQPLVINDHLAWARFQTATWRDLEDFYWERTHAA